jgi:hypothetical protein
MGVTDLLAKRIRYCGFEAIVVCDGRCDKAWGISQRPVLTKYPDGAPKDFVPDADLGTAPLLPGTAEGMDGPEISRKPQPRHPEHRLNKWCVRECERSTMLPDKPGFRAPGVWGLLP